MDTKRGKLTLVLTTLMLLLTLAVGATEPGLAAGADPSTDELHGLLASPFNGGGSGT